MDRNEAQGRVILARGWASREQVHSAWQAARSGAGDLCSVLESRGLLESRQSAAVRAAAAHPSSRLIKAQEPTRLSPPPSGRLPITDPRRPSGVVLSSPRPEPGGSIGGHAIVGELSRGGMGVVFRARHKSLGEEVALKVLLTEEAGERDRVRFEREARAMLKLKHPNIVSFLDYGEENGRPFLAMELIRGQSLDAMLRAAFREGAPPPLPRTLKILKAVAEALAAGHERGLIHRDLKPANVMIEEGTERPVLIDFGLARATAAEGGLTASSDVIGTPSYMAPEQFDGREFGEAGPATDVWGFGGLVSFCLTGRPPFEGSSLSIYNKILAGERPSLRGAKGAPPWLAELCEGCFVLEPTKRLPLSRIREALNTQGSPRRQRPAKRRHAKRGKGLLWSGLGAAIAIALAAAFLLSSGAPRWIEPPPKTAWTRGGALLLKARLSGAGRIKVERSEGEGWRLLAELDADEGGRFSAPITGLRDGPNRLRFVLGDSAEARECLVERDESPPKLSITRAWRNRYLALNKGKVRLLGAVEDAAPERVQIGDETATLRDGRFEMTVEAEAGRPLRVVARDRAGNETELALIPVGAARLSLVRTIQERATWKSSSEAFKGQALKRIAEELGPDFVSRGLEAYGRGGQSFTIGRLEFLPTKTMFHLIPGGEFRMGCADPEGDFAHVNAVNKRNYDEAKRRGYQDLGRVLRNGYESERPAHEVRLPAFLIAAREFSFREFFKGLGRPMPPEVAAQADKPLAGVSWTKIQAFLKRLGGGLRLPSEAEWEYACRAGTTTRYYWGEAMDDRFVHYWKSLGRSGTAPVTAHDALETGNAFGLVDMAGNAWELCQDARVRDYQGARPDGRPPPDPKAPRIKRVMRGGGWLYSGAFWARSSARGELFDDETRNSVGFRPARSLDFLKLEAD